MSGQPSSRHSLSTSLNLGANFKGPIMGRFPLVVKSGLRPQLLTICLEELYQTVVSPSILIKKRKRKRRKDGVKERQPHKLWEESGGWVGKQGRKGPYSSREGKSLEPGTFSLVHPESGQLANRSPSRLPSQFWDWGGIRASFHPTPLGWRGGRATEWEERKGLVWGYPSPACLSLGGSFSSPHSGDHISGQCRLGPLKPLSEAGSVPPPGRGRCRPPQHYQQKNVRLPTRKQRPGRF